MGHFLKHKIADYVIRDEVIGFSDTKIKTFWIMKIMLTKIVAILFKNIPII